MNKIGYVQKGQSKGAVSQLKQAGCDQIYTENVKWARRDWQERPELYQLLKELQPKETLIIPNFETISYRGHVWLELLTHLERNRISIQVLTLPEMSRSELIVLFQWLKETEEGGTYRLKRVKKEEPSEQARYHPLSKQAEFRRVYWEVMEGLLNKQRLGTISKALGVSRGTVFRIRKDYLKFKQASIIIAVFLLTILSLKLAQNYTESFVIQLLICLGMSGMIIFFLYKEDKED